MWKAFPNVIDKTIDENNEFIIFTFGEHKHTASINKHNVFFIEVMDE